VKVTQSGYEVFADAQLARDCGDTLPGLKQPRDAASLSP
jgi:hypothetical protein